ncbi:hypothetical protein KQI68_06435 [Peptoniphilus sp. MSJ-1]|uniref:Uncharacterized protein n=1 Tax=Peptoniphilus ovalis TaxID=2841503 RepID=A0ABS6FH39_9FIRM|nr:hypothetical protein [Peptoniphilus ovalis]MBU5669474.1 hypothetical protein [Peptoniphilus ovalis]
MYNVRILKNQVVWETDKAFLVKFPKTRWKFWVGKKLMQPNQNSYIMMVWDNMKIKLISAAGNSKEITSDDFLEQYGFDLDNDVIEDLEDD